MATEISAIGDQKMEYLDIDEFFDLKLRLPWLVLGDFSNFLFLGVYIQGIGMRGFTIGIDLKYRFLRLRRLYLAYGKSIIW